MKSTIEIPKDEKHRIVIPIGLWRAMKLKYGEFIEIDITKVGKVKGGDEQAERHNSQLQGSKHG